MLTYFTSIGSLAALNVAITEFINSQFKVTKGWVKQLISWVLPILVSILGLVFGLGMFASFGTVASTTAWVYTILTGFGAGLVSNGVYDIQLVQALIEFVKNLKINKE